MITFYKMNGTTAEVGSGIEVPTGYTAYTVGQEPQELQDALLQEAVEAHAEELKRIKNQAVEDKLKAMQYDSLATVKLWSDDATYGAEATAILNWYKALTAMSIQLENDVKAGIIPMPSIEEYKLMIEGVV